MCWQSRHSNHTQQRVGLGFNILNCTLDPSLLVCRCCCCCCCCRIVCCVCPCSHVLPLLDRYISLCLACMEVPRLTEPNMPSANNAIWSMGELVIRVRGLTGDTSTHSTPTYLPVTTLDYRITRLTEPSQPRVSRHKSRCLASQSPTCPVPTMQQSGAWASSSFG
jgi:hypothetical protein